MLFKVSHGREILVRSSPGRVPENRESGAGNRVPQGASIQISLLGTWVPSRERCSWAFSFQLNFIGVTVELGQKYVHFTSTSHQFIPVSIGDTLPPRQVSGLHCPSHQEPLGLISVYLCQPLAG